MYIYRNVFQVKTVVQPDISRDKRWLRKIFMFYYITRLFYHDICEEQFAIYALVPQSKTNCNFYADMTNVKVHMVCKIKVSLKTVGFRKTYALTLHNRRQFSCAHWIPRSPGEAICDSRNDHWWWLSGRWLRGIKWVGQVLVNRGERLCKPGTHSVGRSTILHNVLVYVHNTWMN